MGYGLVWLKSPSEILLQSFECVMAFLLILTINRKPYGLFVFFLSIFIVSKHGLQGIEAARAGGVDRILATLVDIGIAVITSAVLLQFMPKPEDDDS